jgi:iron-sulfur cluster repair protein YtfE (RIC family)
MITAPALAPAVDSCSCELPAPAPVLGFLLVHAALRRDVQDLVSHAERASAAAAEDTSGVSVNAARRVERRLELFDRVLRAHHHGEDRVLLPLLRSREPLVRDISDEVEAQHARLDESLDAMRVHVELGDPAALATRARKLASLLEDHLVLEETMLLPVWLMSLSAEEHATFARRLRHATPWRDIAVMVPWLIDAVPDEYRHLAEAELPGHVRLAYRYGMRHRFERRFGRSTPAR